MCRAKRSKTIRAILVLALAASSLAVVASPAQAATFEVTPTGTGADDGYCTPDHCSLSEAMVEANATPEADTIVLPSTQVGDIVIGTGPFLVDSPITILGNGNTIRGSISRPEGPIFLVRGPLFSPFGSGDLTLSDTIVTGGNGGAIVNEGTLAMTSSTLTENYGGAAIDNGADGIVSIISSTISHNFDGGLVHAGNGSMTIVSSTVAHNDIGIANVNGTGTVDVKASIVAHNGSDCDGTVTSGGFNVAGDLAGCTGIVDGDNDDVEADPMLVPAQFGWDVSPPGTMFAIRSDSPARDRHVASDEDCEGTDQRGVDRPQGSACDAGSYEYTVDRSLDVTVSGSGSGSVVSSGIDCPGDCSESYPDDTRVLPGAVPEPGSTFAGWSGDCPSIEDCRLTMDDDRSIVATFTLDQLDVTVAGSGSGRVTGEGIDCPGDCDEIYAPGTEVALFATADPGSTFTEWSDENCGTAGDCTFTMDSAKAVTAVFDALQPDAHIKTAKSDVYLGDDIYNATGADQTVAKKKKRGKSVVFDLRFQNDGDLPQVLSIAGCGRVRGFRVSYFDAAGLSITADVVEGNHKTRALDPGESEHIQLMVKIKKRGKKKMTCLSTATLEAEPGLLDTVKAIIKAKP